MSVGFTEGLTFDPERPDWDDGGPRPLRWFAWYPAVETVSNPPSVSSSWLKAGPVARDAELRPQGRPYPVVLLSHGTGGVAAGLEWLGSRLAQNGFIAIGINHHGNTGAEPYRAEGFICLWERARDLSALLGDESWRERLRGRYESHAHVAGFSAGAYAAMLLMGARVTYSQFEPDNPVRSPLRGPAEFPNLADAIPRLLESSPVFRASWERRRMDYSDARFRSAFVLAPGRSVLGFDAGTLGCIDRPVRILVGDADAIAPASLCSDWLHHHTPGSRLEILGHGAGHYVFVSEPTALGLQQAPAVFSDPPGVDRRTLHERVALSAKALFTSVG
ncbi:MAG: hypothetical protein P0Y66_21505 [Candidatus Kaistia colombiensis]|nr:MAG: hypothetical protein P0Y66_21505 [Kaistia sp.]